MDKDCGQGVLEGGVGGMSPHKTIARAWLCLRYRSAPAGHAVWRGYMYYRRATLHGGKAGAFLGGGATGGKAPHGGGRVRSL